MQQNLEKNIFSTVCYYDTLNYPLTIFEIWKNLLNLGKEGESLETAGCRMSEVLKVLNGDGLKDFIESKNGFYFLKGREGLVGQRIARNKISVLKLKRMRRVVSFLRVAPFVRMILVTGRLAMKNARPHSDWDVLVVLKAGRIWIGRTAITFLTHILGKRRHHKKIKDRICLNYFITTDSLEIRNKDLFSANEYFFTFPLFETKNYFQKFRLRNLWIRKYKPNYYGSDQRHTLCLLDNGLTRWLRIVGENILDHDFLEKWLEKLELEKIKRNPKSAGATGLIEADRRALIFLPHPQGPKVFEKFKAKLDEIGAFNKYHI